MAVRPSTIHRWAFYVMHAHSRILTTNAYKEYGAYKFVYNMVLTTNGYQLLTISIKKQPDICISQILSLILVKQNLKIMAENIKVRYSDADLAEFKTLIMDKLAVARQDYEQLRASITRSADNDTEDTSPTFKVLEEGAATLSKEEVERLAAHQLKFIKNLEMALVRIEHKTYGVCKTTGKLIPRERLLRVPHATECIEAKEARK